MSYESNKNKGFVNYNAAMILGQTKMTEILKSHMIQMQTKTEHNMNAVFGKKHQHLGNYSMT